MPGSFRLAIQALLSLAFLLSTAVPVGAQCGSVSLTPRDEEVLLSMTPEIAEPFLVLGRGGSGHFYHSATFLNGRSELACIMVEEGSWNLITSRPGLRQDQEPDGGAFFWDSSISVVGFDDEPAYSKRQDRLYFTSARQIDEGDESFQSRIWYLEREYDDEHQEGAAPLLIEGREVEAWSLSVSACGAIWFENEDNSLHMNGNMMRAELTGEGFAAPVAVGILQGEGQGVETPTVAPDEGSIVFSWGAGGNDRQNGFYMVTRRDEGGWNAPRLLKDDANWDGTESHPRFSANGDVLFFCRDVLEEGLDYEQHYPQLYWVGTESILPETPPGQAQQTR